MKQSVNSHFISPYCEYTYSTRKIRFTFSYFLHNVYLEWMFFLDARLLYSTMFDL